MGILIILIPRLYLSQDYQGFAQITNEKGENVIEWNFFKYYYHMLPKSLLKMSWLWFLLALFINSMICYPLLGWVGRRAKKVPVDLKTDGVYAACLLFIMFIWALPNLYVGPSPVNKEELFPMVIVLTAMNLIFMALTTLDMSYQGRAVQLMIKNVGFVTMMFLNYYRDGRNQETSYGFLAMINYDVVFLA